MVDRDREEIIKKQVQKEKLNGSSADMLSSPIKHMGNLSLWVLHPSPEPEVTSLQLPRCHSRTAMLISRETSWACRSEIGDHLQHESQERYRNSYKTPNSPELLSCPFERGPQLSITNRTARITSADSSGIWWEGQGNQSHSWPFPRKMLSMWSQSINRFQ